MNQWLDLQGMEFAKIKYTCSIKQFYVIVNDASKSVQIMHFVTMTS